MRDLDIKEKTYRGMSEKFPVEFDEFLNDILIHKTLLERVNQIKEEAEKETPAFKWSDRKGNPRNRRSE